MSEQTHQNAALAADSSQSGAAGEHRAGPGSSLAGSGGTNGSPVPMGSSWLQYGLALMTFAGVSLLNLWLQQWIGYQAIALLYLLAVVLLALFVSRGPILLGTALTALGWNFLFAPPRYSFHIGSFYDKMMCAMYFVVALVVGQLTALLRAQRAAERQREARTREAEINSRLLAESERLGRTLLNSVSHELRTPIAAITSAASSLRASGALSAAQQNLTGEIESAAARLNRVVQSLLSAARLQSGQLRPKLDWCDISELVKVTLRGVEGLLAGHPVQKQIPAGIPLVRADFVLMEQALANLVINAATHTPPETPIQVEARVEEATLVLEVADRGPGLPPDQIDRAFDLFHRAPTARPGGTGLGLAIVKGFVEAQGGSVRAGNRPQGGAVFCICLPVAEPPELQEETL
ncbi:MAG TPA: ATP-binding protein [Candidatus Binatia bacterium]|jgi:K+-sensing histidine kinase KdpD|nr:ATP-binding protein [Candidatus Binatia bacterium]